MEEKFTGFYTVDGRAINVGDEIYGENKENVELYVAGVVIKYDNNFYIRDENDSLKEYLMDDSMDYYDIEEEDEYEYEDYWDDRLDCGCCACCGCTCYDYDEDEEEE